MTRHYTFAKLYGNSVLVRGWDDSKKDTSMRRSPFVLPCISLQTPTQYTTLEGDYVAPAQPGTIKETRQFIDQYSGISGTQSVWDGAFSLSVPC